MTDQDRRKERDKSVQAYGFILQFFLNMVVPIGVLSYLGYRADVYLGTSFIVFIGFFIGAISGWTSIMKMSRGFTRRDKTSIDYPVVDKRDEIEADNSETEETK